MVSALAKGADSTGFKSRLREKFFFLFTLIFHLNLLRNYNSFKYHYCDKKCNIILKKNVNKWQKNQLSLGFEPGTFELEGQRVNHYTKIPMMASGQNSYNMVIKEKTENFSFWSWMSLNLKLLKNLLQLFLLHFGWSIFLKKKNPHISAKCISWLKKKLLIPNHFC